VTSISEDRENNQHTEERNKIFDLEMLRNSLDSSKSLDDFLSLFDKLKDTIIALNSRNSELECQIQMSQEICQEKTKEAHLSQTKALDVSS
jgi:hypothetical protein